MLFLRVPNFHYQFFKSLIIFDGIKKIFKSFPKIHSLCTKDNVSHKVLDIQAISPSAEMEKLTKLDETSSPRDHSPNSRDGRTDPKSPYVLNDSSDSRIWIMKEAAAIDTEPDSGADSEAHAINVEKKNVDDNEVSEVVFSEEASHQLLQEQLAVLRAEQEKLRHETEMLKLKKDKLKLQMTCFTNEIRKQEMEKEKLRLEIKLLQSKVVEDANDVSHYIFVP